MFEHRKAEPLGFRSPRRHSNALVERFHGWQMGLPPFVKVHTADVPTIVAIGGGKGGVGKSVLSANFAARLGQIGYRVLVIDMDLGCSNLHTHFGIGIPKKSLSDFVVQSRMDFQEIVHPTAISNVGVVPGGREETWTEFLEGGTEVLKPLWDSMLQCRQTMGVDFVILDLGAGTSRMTIDFFLAAHLGIATVLPEPTSIENAYVFMKSVLWQLVENVGFRNQKIGEMREVRSQLLEAGGSFNNGYADCLRRLANTYPEYIGQVMTALRSRSMGIVVNQSRSQADIDIGTSMEQISRRYFGLPASFLGHLNYDDSAWKSLRNRRLLVIDFPHSLLAKRLSKVTVNALSNLGYYGGPQA